MCVWYSIKRLCCPIVTEVGKNINQDKSLKIKRYVEDYHKYVSSLNIPSGAKHQRREDPTKHGKRKGN